MLYADENGKWLPQLLPFLPTFAPLFDSLGPHLAVLRPHLPQLLPHLKNIAPFAIRFAPYVTCSANADILLHYFGWILRIPILGRLVMRLPFLPRFSAFLSSRLPKRPVRGRTWDYVCDWEDCDVVQYESRLARRRAPIGGGELDLCCGDTGPASRQTFRAQTA